MSGGLRELWPVADRGFDLRYYEVEIRIARMPISIQLGDGLQLNGGVNSSMSSRPGVARGTLRPFVF